MHFLNAQILSTQAGQIFRKYICVTSAHPIKKQHIISLAKPPGSPSFLFHPHQEEPLSFLTP